MASKLNMMAKILGCSEVEVARMVQKNPLVLTFSNEKIQRVCEFLTNAVGVDTKYIQGRPSMLLYSLERRLVPRHYVMKVLREKGLVPKDHSFFSMPPLSDSVFCSKSVVATNIFCVSPFPRSIGIWLGFVVISVRVLDKKAQMAPVDQRTMLVNQAAAFVAVIYAYFMNPDQTAQAQRVEPVPELFNLDRPSRFEQLAQDRTVAGWSSSSGSGYGSARAAPDDELAGATTVAEQSSQ
uniref:Mitochondrial transcription termination factor family protein n=1 Tax=Zea mays TaxID=4577 RepID=A0A804PPA2_MAIZE